MDINTVAMKLGYPSIFSGSAEDAAANLLRLIIDHDCGYDEGPNQWHEIVCTLLDSKSDLTHLNACGAKLTADQWRQTLRLLRADLAAYIDHGEK